MAAWAIGQGRLCRCSPPSRPLPAETAPWRPPLGVKTLLIGNRAAMIGVVLVAKQRAGQVRSRVGIFMRGRRVIRSVTVGRCPKSGQPSPVPTPDAPELHSRAHSESLAAQNRPEPACGASGRRPSAGTPRHHAGGGGCPHHPDSLAARRHSRKLVFSAIIASSSGIIIEVPFDITFGRAAQRHTGLPIVGTVHILQHGHQPHPRDCQAQLVQQYTAAVGRKVIGYPTVVPSRTDHRSCRSSHPPRGSGGHNPRRAPSRLRSKHAGEEGERC